MRSPALVLGDSARIVEVDDDEVCELGYGWRDFVGDVGEIWAGRCSIKRDERIAGCSGGGGLDIDSGCVPATGESSSESSSSSFSPASVGFRAELPLSPRSGSRMLDLRTDRRPSPDPSVGETGGTAEREVEGGRREDGVRKMADERRERSDSVAVEMGAFGSTSVEDLRRFCRRCFSTRDHWARFCNPTMRISVAVRVGQRVQREPTDVRDALRLALVVVARCGRELFGILKLLRCTRSTGYAPLSLVSPAPGLLVDARDTQVDLALLDEPAVGIVARAAFVERNEQDRWAVVVPDEAVRARFRGRPRLLTAKRRGRERRRWRGCGRERWRGSVGAAHRSSTTGPSACGSESDRAKGRPTVGRQTRGDEICEAGTAL